MNGQKARVVRAHRHLPVGHREVDAAFKALEAELAKVDPATVTDADRADVTAFLDSLERQYPTPRTTGRHPGVR